MKSYSIQFFYNAALSSAAVFTPVYANSLGASDLTVGYIGMVYGISIFAAGIVFGRQADVKGRRRFLVVGLGAAALLACLQLFALDPFALLITRFALGFAAGMFPPALVAYASDEGKLMGKFAAFGSLGYGIGNLLVSFCAWATWLFGALALFERVYFTCAVFLAAAFAVSLLLPTVPRKQVDVPAFPTAVIRRNRDVYVSFLIRHTGANAVWIIFPLFVLEKVRAAGVGNEYAWLGVIYAANSLTQALIMRFLDPFDGRRLVAVGEALTVLTFIGFYFSADHIQLLLWSFVLAASWSCLYVGSLKTILARSPEKATASGLLASTTSMSAIIGPLLGGLVSNYFGGYSSTIIVAAVMTVAALVVFKVLTDRVERQYGPSTPAPLPPPEAKGP